MASQKPIHSLVVDTGPLIKNAVGISTMLQEVEEIFTTPAILSEIRDPATRSRVETTLLPFLKVRSPSPASYETVAAFSKKTGDFVVLSRQDLSILALAYELECERLGGNWRLRSTPGQKEPNGKPPKKEEKENPSPVADKEKANASTISDLTSEDKEQEPSPKPDTEEQPTEVLEQKLSELRVSEPASTTPQLQDHSTYAEPSDDSDEGEWITPSNIKSHQSTSANPATQKSSPKQMAVATMTTDFAMQNVLLQMNLNLLSTNMQRIKQLRTYILRCHACFLTTKQMEKQFCPRCGQASLQRVACSTNANGEFKIHLAKNYQWNTRGDRYSIPKPVWGAANGKVKGGGKGGWGNDLVLAEDQKEYVRANAEEKRRKTRDLMDEDYLPGILTGDRGRAGGRTKVGAGKNVNSRKRVG